MDSFGSKVNGSSSRFVHSTTDRLDRIGVARIFDWGGGKPQLTCNNVIKIFRKRNFLWGEDIVKWKIKSRGLIWH